LFDICSLLIDLERKIQGFLFFPGEWGLADESDVLPPVLNCIRNFLWNTANKYWESGLTPYMAEKIMHLQVDQQHNFTYHGSILSVVLVFTAIKKIYTLFC
jgi:hypothetical protein